ncbi:hypothetical protein DYD83_15290 [Dickeya fangzhongdai]|uniref:Uncharacterized protein n=1 Tax=Dickeya fangzhongdai TaxID=1778540 RepID=A0A2K8QR75_9GAMM|nr:hypothetical protein CVE23_15225 [Dickeya fangzhongdai]QOH48651.1 hypothetical protein DYD82_15290 [Dickeya fangzhongdai]QOH52955.1 hypothetical protein DYD83_15290 [Dickeya fangzhongdai]
MVDITDSHDKWHLYPSYFKLQMRWLSSLTPVTYSCKRLGIRCVAAFLQLELFWVYLPNKRAYAYYLYKLQA